MAWFFKKNDVGEEAPEAQEADGQSPDGAPALDKAQSFGSAILPVMACGAGLFSDGYINNVGC